MQVAAVKGMNDVVAAAARTDERTDAVDWSRSNRPIVKGSRERLQQTQEKQVEKTDSLCQ